MKKNDVIYSDSSLENLVKRRNQFFRKRLLLTKCGKWLPIIFSVVFFESLLLKIIIPAVYWLFYTIFLDYQQIFDFRPVINVWFGIPGSGKTTTAALIARYGIKGLYPVLSNVPIVGTYQLDNDDLGRFDMSFDGTGAQVIIDEAVDGFDSRDFKTFSKEKKTYFATHRHQTNRVDVFSQGYDIDKRIRDRAGSRNLYHLRKTFLPGFVSVRFISKVMFIKKEDKQMIDGFKYRGLPRVIYARHVWNSFDTLDTSLIPKARKQWKYWYDDVPPSDDD